MSLPIPVEDMEFDPRITLVESFRPNPCVVPPGFANPSIFYRCCRLLPGTCGRLTILDGQTGKWSTLLVSYRYGTADRSAFYFHCCSYDKDELKASLARDQLKVPLPRRYVVTASSFPSRSWTFRLPPVLLTEPEYLFFSDLSSFEVLSALHNLMTGPRKRTAFPFGDPFEPLIAQFREILHPWYNRDRGPPHPIPSAEDVARVRQLLVEAHSYAFMHEVTCGWEEAERKRTKFLRIVARDGPLEDAIAMARVRIEKHFRHTYVVGGTMRQIRPFTIRVGCRIEKRRYRKRYHPSLQKNQNDTNGMSREFYFRRKRRRERMAAKHVTVTDRHMTVTAEPRVPRPSKRVPTQHQPPWIQVRQGRCPKGTKCKSMSKDVSAAARHPSRTVEDLPNPRPEECVGSRFSVLQDRYRQVRVARVTKKRPTCLATPSQTRTRPHARGRPDPRARSQGVSHGAKRKEPRRSRPIGTAVQPLPAVRDDIGKSLAVHSSTRSEPSQRLEGVAESSAAHASAADRVPSTPRPSDGSPKVGRSVRPPRERENPSPVLKERNTKRAPPNIRALFMSRFPWKNVHNLSEGVDSQCAIHFSSGGRVSLTIRTHAGAPPVKPSGPARRATSGTLDAISNNRIRVEALKEFYPELYDTLSPLWDLEKFRERVLKSDIETTTDGTAPISGMAKHLDRMIGFRIVSRARKVKMVMRLFTVEKKNGLLRLIQDCRPLNSRCHRPPKMPLPPLHHFISKILDAEVAGTADGRSYFYQFGLGPEVKEYFGAKIRRARGHFDTFTMESLPMGFSWAPYFAQLLSNVVVDTLGLAWVDNFIVLGTNEDDYAQKKAEFLRRIRLLGIELDDYELPAHRQIELIGIYFDLEQKTYRLSDDFVAKAMNRIEKILVPGLTVDCIEVMEAIGSIVWFSFVAQRPLCRCPHTMFLLQHIARLGWDKTVTLTRNELDELSELKSLIGENPPMKPRPVHDVEVQVEGDASDDFSAYLIYRQCEVLTAKIKPLPADQHIFLSELDVAVTGCLEAYRRGFKGVEYRGDNMASLFALKKRLSTNFQANGMLQRLPDDLTVVTTWVPTDQILADPFTRGIKFPPMPTHLDEIKKLHHSFRNCDAPKVGAQAHHCEQAFSFDV